MWFRFRNDVPSFLFFLCTKTSSDRCCVPLGVIATAASRLKNIKLTKLQNNTCKAIICVHASLCMRVYVCVYFQAFAHVRQMLYNTGFRLSDKLGFWQMKRPCNFSNRLHKIRQHTKCINHIFINAMGGLKKARSPHITVPPAACPAYCATSWPTAPPPTHRSNLARNQPARHISLHPGPQPHRAVTWPAAQPAVTCQKSVRSPTFN